MDKNEISVRIAGPEDAEEILNIYAPYVRKTAITFEYEVPDAEEFRKRIRHTLEKYPYIVAVKDGKIRGYAYTGAFVGRAAYDWAAETSIYVDENQKKSGLGRRLYQVLEEISKAQNILNLNACIGVPETEDAHLNWNSMQFHEHLGYRLVGEFYRCGYKFGRWYNMVWMEKLIGEHTPEPEPVIPFPELSEDVLQKMGIKRKN